MKKINVLKESKDFERIIKSNKSYRGKYYYIYIESVEDQKYYRFGLSVSKKLGNAVVRNLYKRRLRSIIDKCSYISTFNAIIILKKEVLNVSYQELENSLIDDFKKLKLTRES